MPTGGQWLPVMDMLGMEYEQFDTARGRAGSCVEFYNVKVSFLLLFYWYLKLKEEVEYNISIYQYFFCFKPLENGGTGETYGQTG